MVGMIKKEFPAYNVSELILDYRPRFRITREDRLLLLLQKHQFENIFSTTFGTSLLTLNNHSLPSNISTTVAPFGTPGRARSCTTSSISGWHVFDPGQITHCVPNSPAREGENK